MEPGQPPAPLPPLPLTWARLTAGVGNRGWEQGLLLCSPLRVTACHPNPEADVPFSLLPVFLLSGGPEIQRPWDGSAWEAAVQVFTLTQNSCLENPRDGGAWWAAVRGVAKSRTRLSDFTFTFHFHALEKAMAPHSSALAWRIPGTGEPGGLPSMGSHSWTRLK